MMYAEVETQQPMMIDQPKANTTANRTMKLQDLDRTLEDLMDVIRFKEAAVKRGNHHSCIERELEELKAEFSNWTA